MTYAIPPTVKSMIVLSSARVRVRKTSWPGLGTVAYDLYYIGHRPPDYMSDGFEFFDSYADERSALNAADFLAKALSLSKRFTPP